MGNWSISPNISHSNNGVFNFPENTGSTDVSYIVTYTNDLNCSKDTTIVVPKKEPTTPPVLTLPDISFSIVSQVPGYYIEFVKMDGIFGTYNNNTFTQIQTCTCDFNASPVAGDFAILFDYHGTYVSDDCQSPTHSLISNVTGKLTTGVEICAKVDGSFLSTIDDLYLKIFVGQCALYYAPSPGSPGVRCTIPARLRDISGNNFVYDDSGYNTLISRKPYKNLGSTTFVIEEN